MKKLFTQIALLFIIVNLFAQEISVDNYSWIKKIEEERSNQLKEQILKQSKSLFNG